MALVFNPFTGNFDNVMASSSDMNFSGGSLNVNGDLTLDSGGAFTTTVQAVTPTANRTISFPDATGTVALVAGSTGQVTYNDAGAQAGLTSANIGSTGAIDISLAGAASTPPVTFTGSWFTGGTATTTKPQLLIEPTGTTSTAWSTSGTGIGVNAASGFGGNLLDLQVNGSSRFKASSLGHLTFTGTGATTVLSINSFGDNLLLNRPFFVQSVAQVDVNGFTLRTPNGKVNLGAGSEIRWKDTNDGASGTVDLSLFRDAAGTLAQRNGTNAQTFRLYNTYTDASNYERGFLQWNSNVLEIGSEGAGTGSEQPVRITAATLKLPNLPTYADNAAATTGGLVAGDVYKPATGELRITV